MKTYISPSITTERVEAAQLFAASGPDTKIGGTVDGGTLGGFSLGVRGNNVDVWDDDNEE